jgi:glycosyltransferase involved in cell wall biosynthesis
MAAGVPVIAFGRGGALDTVIDGVTGVLFPEQTVASVCDAIEVYDRTVFEREKLSAHVVGFRPDVFASSMRKVVSGALV